MEQLILTIVKPLVDFPDKVQVEKVEETNKVVYKLILDSTDIGKVIGKHGRVAKAIRTVVYAHAAATEQKKVYLDISE